SRLVRAQALLLQAVDLELQVRFDFGGEVVGVARAAEHASTFDRMGIEHARDRAGKTLPLAGFPDELLPARSGEGVEARAPIVLGCAPLPRNPPASLEALQRRVERAVLDQQFIFGGLLDRAHDRVAVLRLEDQRPQNQQIEGSLQEVERFVPMGRHLTEAWTHLGSDVNLTDDQPALVLFERPGTNHWPGETGVEAAGPCRSSTCSEAASMLHHYRR